MSRKVSVPTAINVVAMKDKLSEMFTIRQVVLNRPSQVVRSQTYLDDVAVLHSDSEAFAEI